MKNKFLCLILALIMTMSFGAFSASAEESLILNAEFEFSAEGEFLVVSGTTSAKYGQAINVVVYDPAFIDGLEDIRESNGELSDNPAEMKPLSDVSNLIRWTEVKASVDGEYNVKFPLSGIEDGQYLIIKAAGSGKTPLSASVLRQYYTDETISNVTLPAFESAEADDLENLLKQNQLVLGIELGADYRENKDAIHNMFVSVRDNDCEVSAETGKKFNSMDDIKNVLKIVEALRDFPTNPNGDSIKSYIGRYGKLIEYDFSEENEHYSLMKNSAYPIAAVILNETAPECMTDIKTAIAQSVAIALLNTKNATTVAPVIEEYSILLGLDSTDYEIYCEKYSAYEVNKAFVSRNFTKPSEVLAALEARINELEKKPSSGGGSGGGGGGGGGSFSGSATDSTEITNNSSLNNVLSVNDQLITSNKDKDVAKVTYYSDITDSHWAYSSIKTLSSKDIITGYPDGSFKPEAVVTREQFVKMLISAFELDSSDAALNFEDVETDRWSAPFIKIAVNAGVVNGVTETTFNPEAAISRQDAAVMIARLCGKVGIELSKNGEVTDSDKISAYALESVEKLVASGIISGFEDGSYRPMENLTRAQAAKLICGLIEK